MNIFVPLDLLRIPAVQIYLAVLAEKLTFDIPVIVYVPTMIFYFSLLGIAALLLNAELDVQVLLLF